jgi:hypothetical protein
MTLSVHPPSDGSAARRPSPKLAMPVITILVAIVLALAAIVILLAQRPVDAIATPAGSFIVTTPAPTKAVLPFPMRTISTKDMAACKKAFDTSVLGSLERMKALGEEASRSDDFELQVAGDDLVTATELALSGRLNRDDRSKAVLLASSLHRHLMGECLSLGYKET